MSALRRWCRPAGTNTKVSDAIPFRFAHSSRIPLHRRYPDVRATCEESAEEIQSLQRCINDLTSILELPATWTGGEPTLVVSTLLESLIRVLRLDFVCAWLEDPVRDPPGETLRVTTSRELSPRLPELRQLLQGLHARDPQNWPALLRDPLGDGDLSLVALPLGLHDRGSMIVAGSRRAQFPHRTERLLLSVAANQATIALQEARLLGEQKRAATQLEQCVAQRTRELAAAVDELQLRLSMMDVMPVAVWSATPDGARDIVNRRWFEYTGQTPEDINSHPEAWLATIHPEDRERAARIYRDGIRSGSDFTMEARFMRAHDRTYRWLLNRTVALRDAEGNIIRFVGTCTDIEDLREAQDELRSTQAALAHTTRVMTMGVLTASIAHEVSQPLAGIITNTNTCLRMLGSDHPNVEGARDTARRTIRDANRASDVITRLRALFARRDVAAEPVDLNEAVREVIALCSVDLQRNGALLRLELADDLPTVMGDRVQLQQVMLNLLTNASEAMIGINDRPRTLLVRTELDEAGLMRVTVRDSGVGFDPGDAHKLFAAFHTTKQAAMGIGLSVSRSIIENHHGRIWAVATDGPGAAFSFTIPRPG
jgi:PAS domain S-box-containing protein